MRLVFVAVLFILAIASGFWVVKLGRPLNTGVFTVHKLLALAALVMMITMVRAMAKGAVLSPAAAAAIALTFVLFAAMIATGGMLSFEKEWPGFVKIIHKIVPYVTLAAGAAAVYLLKG